MKEKPKVGDIVCYQVENTREQAQIIAVKGSTEATIRLLTGPQCGQEFDAPWGIIEPCD